MNIGAKIASGLVAAAAGMAANFVLKKGWRAVTGHEAPFDETQDVDLGELLVFAAVSGVVLTLFQRTASRQTAKWLGEVPKHSA